MAQLAQEYLFDWSHVEAASDLDRLRLVLGAVPDEAFMNKLEVLRGRGRDEYPVRCLSAARLAAFRPGNSASG